jgi:hypothetical protein
MATLVLTTVGTIIAGPVGGAVGAVLGQAIDQRIFAPKARHGPRLGDLAVQTSSYGSQLPKLFGTMRVAGTVIWATDLIETRTSSGGGKGRPKTIGYSYAANFAVALSSRPVGAVRRIWADGKLLRGAGGDFKTGVGAFRLYGGGEDQPVDPLIASAEGIGLCPAYRGIAYAVFEELQLEDYGNRIPSLTFEVEADPSAPSIGGIAYDLSGGAITDGGTPSVTGYAATGDGVRSAVEAIAEIVPLTLVDTGEALSLRAPAGAQATVLRADCSAPPEITRRAAGSVAGEVALGFYDPARDHQAGLQRAFRDGPTGRADSRSLAVAIGAEQAKGFAEKRLGWLWAARSTAKLRLGWRGIPLRPGSIAALEGEPGFWLVERWLLGPMSVELELARLPHADGTLPGASSGRAVGEPDQLHGPTLLRLFDLPLPGEGERPWLAAVAAGTSPGWRRALLTASFDGGASWQDLGPTAAAAAIGTSVNAPAAASAALFDEAGILEVDLLHAEMNLEGRGDSALSGGANLAVLGSELIQFGGAERIGERRFRLSRLLRGRRGTEWAAAGHMQGETFALLNEVSVLPLPVPTASKDAEALVAAVGIGDPSGGVQVSCTVSAESLRPPSPVHLDARRLAGGDIVVAWVRRSRLGWTWTSGSDTPVGEEEELYQVKLASGPASRTIASAEPYLLYTAAEQAADGLQGPLAIAVVQVGTHAYSRPTQVLLG